MSFSKKIVFIIKILIPEYIRALKAKPLYHPRTLFNQLIRDFYFLRKEKNIFHANWG